MENQLSRLQERLDAAIRRAGRVIVAYSGGIDSAYLAFAAYRLLGEGMLAVIADSPSLARSHYREALEFAATHGIPLKTVETGEMEREAYAINDANRCFHCKDELFTVLERERVSRGFDTVAYGLNVDDKKDFRPGQQAAEAHHVVAPLAEARLTKADVRALAQAAGLAIWDKPASACLSSRIEYGRRVTPENLRMVEDAEEGLRALGMRQFRVRHHGTMARVEIAEEELATGLTRERLKQISTAVRAAGFQYVAVDCDGYRSGAMNEILPVEALLRTR
ncbi:ATP-dependent sacrificial sulfur transferase LarE [Silvibacterium dinghuense]|uniref:ATP-dependent sacrificial sulfur transferase LarE n=2 Tax=Silvibacterium dinghuense TaxID=1560006 RepID=A0A4Q1SLD6_9BACT|nr:ATP-dependent sacrificial sulfur transferase LarE [Silvibacterium dinghuense]